MTLPTTVLGDALKLYGVDKRGGYLKGTFYDLGITLRVNSNMLSPEFDNAQLLLANISQDVWNIATLINRLEWSRREANNIPHLKESWKYYTSVDIEHFHVETRSIMDYVSELIGIFTGNKGTLPTSFMRLIERNKKLVLS